MTGIGSKFGRLTIIAAAEPNPNWKKKLTRWLCECECGKRKEVSQCHLHSGATLSCGCLGAERRAAALTIHGASQSQLFRVWNSMLERCYNEETRGYHNYGGRGIKVCDRWRNSFKAFMEDMGERPKDYTIERVDNDGDYRPDNCVWATRKQQGANKRDNIYVMLDSEQLIISEASKRLGLSASAISHRAIRTGDSHQKVTNYFARQRGRLRVVA